jgi:hypothetical protein
MSSGEQEELRLADQLESCCLHVGDIEQYHAALALRRLVAEREADRAVMREALEALEYHVEQTRPIDRSSAAISKLRARVG